MNKPTIRHLLSVGLMGIVGASLNVSAEVGERALKACLAPDFDPADGAPFVSLDSPTYPVMEKKTDGLEDPGDATSMEALGAQMDEARMMGVFALLPMNSFFFSLATALCNHDLYAQNGCEGMSMAFGGKATLEDVTMDDGQLSYVIRSQKDDSVYRMTIGDSDYNTVTMSVTKGGETTDQQLTRDADGTEHYRAESSNGDTIQFLERPDCSGTYTQRDTLDGRLDRTIHFAWTSAKSDAMKVQWTECRYDNGKKTCSSGEF
ncbi:MULTISPECIES: hypothetical protein [unclassified Modicisalibacter]|uniref:hypothetical protein n=1 Tax=unclassified Modicisalibacter TaxID=2679913 RepID=UPI001CCF6EE8|nr:MULTISPECIES: hypothetical protein [unclassified Modicisalibacter]MBZ9557898.1 hypothetical protein [Modicisalibacter sp. R2A 31.J]MBZ9573435.1 hypothetical protein [Modicisalibacter sp. MOD 31.J]